MVFKKGYKPWNKGLKTGIIPKTAFKEGHIPEKPFKKGQTPWNYIDGRSKEQTWNRYGDDWFKIRQLILIRDNFQCQMCGKKQEAFLTRLHIHHKIPFLVSHNNSLDNLVTLCPTCHKKIEIEITKKIKEGGIVIWQ